MKDIPEERRREAETMAEELTQTGLAGEWTLEPDGSLEHNGKVIAKTFAVSEKNLKTAMENVKLPIYAYNVRFPAWRIPSCFLANVLAFAVAKRDIQWQESLLAEITARMSEYAEMKSLMDQYGIDGLDSAESAFAYFNDQDSDYDSRCRSLDNSGKK
jgi:hypothetical protein